MSTRYVAGSDGGIYDLDAEAMPEGVFAMATAPAPAFTIIAGLRYPGDDGGEPPEVREAKAQAYAERVDADAEAAAKANAEADRAENSLTARIGRMIGGIFK
jgi:hypothetical protein